MIEMIQASESADVLVVNFGLHWLVHEKKEFVNEIRELVKVLKNFASQEGKVLIWRENSAQFHLSDGGEWPAKWRKGG